MSEINIESYFKSLVNFSGELAKEQVARIQEANKDLEILPQDELFYAKGMFEYGITDEFYFFNENRMRVVSFDLSERKVVRSVSIIEHKYSSFDTVILNFNDDYGVTLLIQLKNGVELRFNNQNDARGKWAEVHGRQIKAIYNLMKS